MTQLAARTGVSDTYPNPFNAVAKAALAAMWDVINEISQAAEIDLASAATTNIGGQASRKLRITGTTGITSFGTTYHGPIVLRFSGALTITHYATTLICPGGVNLITAAGDTCFAIPKCTTSGTFDGWKIIGYERATGVVAATGLISTGAVAATGLISTSGNDQVFAAATAGTERKYANLMNASVDLLWGIEGAAGGQIFAGTPAYSAVLGTVGGDNLYLVQNSELRVTLSSTGMAVAGTVSATAITRASAAGVGVASTSTDDIGVYGASTDSAGVYGTSTNSYGVYGIGANSYGVVAQSDTISPAKAAFRIFPQDTQPSGANAVGDIYVTTAGVLKICTGAGTPGTWVSVGSQT